MKKYLSITILLLSSLCLWAGGAKEEKSLPVEEVVSINAAALKGPTAFSMIQMFESPGTANFELLPSPDVAVAKLAKGELDVAVLPLNLAAVLYNKGLPYKMVATTGSGVLYLVTSRTDIKDWTDLKGKTVYSLGKGATPELVFNYLLTKHNLEPKKDVELDFSYSQTDLAAALIGGVVDTALIPEPFVTMVTTKNSELKVSLDLQKSWKEVSEEGNTYPMTGLVMKTSLLEHPEVVSSFLLSYSQSVDYVVSHPVEAGKLVEKWKVGVPAAIAAKAIPRLNISLVPAFESKRAVLDYLKVLYDQNPASVGGQIPDEEFFYFEQ
ncbi:ABC transporter substrate-binding protein [Spirochaeta cellobiosiphila]|uniref:ABC transporter substrate-binding protein n=1 Tax=Spirochaeta cellobiosiphila TaxID=504483 RepID=UPI0003FEA84B|nr:MqnA/MqnD/SBP family protein [Spirochaeta cellobiosiphila]